MPTAQVVLAVLIGTGLAPAPARAQPADPQLAIAVDDGRTSATAGDEPSYAITVRNLGTTDADELRISQTVPTGLSLISADHEGAVAPAQVTWMVNLKQGERITLTTVGRVGPTDAELLRLAVVACATAKDGSRPLVCATDSDLLPAGAAARAPASSSRLPWYAAALAALLAVVGLTAFVVWRSRRRPGPPPPTSGVPTGESVVARHGPVN